MGQYKRALSCEAQVNGKASYVFIFNNSQANSCRSVAFEQTGEFNKQVPSVFRPDVVSLINPVSCPK